MNLSSFDNTSLPSESPDSRLRRETTTEHTNNNATSIPDASVVTIGSAVSIKEEEKNFSSKLNKVGTNLKSFVGFIGPGYTLAIKLGVVTGLACRTFLPKGLNYVLYVLCELAIIACDLAEVIGSAIALNLLFNLPLPAGVAITACDILLLLLIYRDNDIKAANIFEIMLMLLVGVVGFCFVVELVYSKPNSADVLKGYLPSTEIFKNGEELYIAIGIIGATVMPHNLYLHSHLVQVRKNREESKGFDDKQLESAESQKSKIKSIVDNTLKLSIADSSVALLFALFVNSAILIVSGANFFYNSPNNPKPADLFDAYDLLTSYLGKAAATIFAIALLIAGQSATITATMAGQVVMEGFCEWKLKPWVRRLITRGFAVIPAMIIAIVRGRNGLNDLLVASQVALSIQLPFAVIPMVWFTSQKKFMQVNTKDLEERVIADKLIRQNKSSTQPNLNSIISVTSSTPALTHSQTPDAGVSNEIYTSKPYDNHDKDNDILDFTNSITLTIISVIVSIVILGLDMYLVVTTIKG
ncbi:33306_t:CDS:2 [Gigaspora margarita]|uniref:33306_t:CDS:1 n=1 Tax=Gigaspora margarita TaxID=4874 RepID=A0ABN7UZK2_GIGMA|nr:33306_t:CDS:2 [Gigaspora margarita]